MHNALPSLLLALLVSTLLLGSCGLVESENDGTPQTDSTYFRATLNGEIEWKGPSRGVFYERYGFNLLSISGGKNANPEQRYSYREKLTFNDLKYNGSNTYSLVSRNQRVGNYSLGIGASYYEIDGDVIISSYDTNDDTSANQLTITSYDSTTGLMKGTFRTTLVVDSAQRVSEPGEPPRRRPDTLRYTNGEFRVKVEDRR